MLNPIPDLFKPEEPSVSIKDLPLTENGKLDEEAIPPVESEPPPVLDNYMPKTPPVVDDVQVLYERGALVSVQHNVKP